MPHQVPVARPARLRRCGALFLAFVLLCCAPALAGRLTAALDIAPGKWKSVHLKNLPKDAPVAVQVQASGDIFVAFVRVDTGVRPPGAATPEFQGKVEHALSFSVTIPRAGDYLLILDNRKGDAARKVELVIRADKPAPAEEPPPRPRVRGGTETRI